VAEPLKAQNQEVVSALRSWGEGCAFLVLREHLSTAVLVNSAEVQERAVMPGRDLEGIFEVAMAEE
jgi:hypothetical protein